MASQRFFQELAAELPRWVADGVIPQETADALARYCVADSTRSAKNHLQIFLGVLCALLIGAGLILLISHNWDQFPPAVRLAFAWVPLAATILFGFRAVTRHGDEPAWCEPAALLLMAATASAIAIVSQVYQCVGTLSDFLLLLLALTLLPMYGFRSTVLSAVFAVGFFAMLPEGQAQMPWLMLLALAAMPHLWRSATGGVSVRGRRQETVAAELAASAPGGVSVGVRQLNQLAIASILFCLNLFCMMRINGHDDSLIACLMWPLLCCVLLQAGWLAAGSRAGAMNALRGIGAIGFLVLSMCGTYQDFWREFRLGAPGDRLVELYLGALALVWLGLGWRLRSPGRSYVAAYPILFLLCMLLGAYRHEGVAMLLGNLYLLLLGAGMLVSGFRTRSLWCMNRGLGVLTILIFLRFCASDDILLRAFVFLGLGIAVGVFNLVFVRKLKKMEAAA